MTQIHTVGVCPQCSAQVVTPVPLALCEVIASSAGADARAEDLAGRLQLVVLKATRLRQELQDREPPHDSGASKGMPILEELLGIIKAATTPAIVAS